MCHRSLALPRRPVPAVQADVLEDQADQDCPFIPGAAFRLSLSYEDPKLSDGTPQEAQVYDAKVVEIGTELLYAFQKARQ